MDLGFIGLILVFGIQQAITIFIASQGELITEKSGVLNIGLEGVMLMSAFTAAAVDATTGQALGQWAPIVGMAAGIVTGMFANLIFATLSTKLHVDQVIAGIGINIFALGITYVVSALRFTIDGTPLSNSIQPLVIIRGFSSGLSIGMSSLVLVMFSLPVLVYLLLYRTKFGLHIRAAGENPKAADAAGVSVVRTRILATTLGGALLGMAGSYLTVDLFNQFIPNITGGIGFIALSAVIAGAWNPTYVLGVSFIFGSSVGLINVVSKSAGPEFYLITMLPYVITVAVLAIASKRLRPPAALALPFKKE